MYYYSLMKVWSLPRLCCAVKTHVPEISTMGGGGGGGGGGLSFNM